MAQSRHQPGVSPINPSVRAQVPQFLSPQVLGYTVYIVNITSVVLHYCYVDRQVILVVDFLLQFQKLFFVC